MGEDSVLQSILSTEELDTPTDVLHKNEEFEEVPSDGETIGGVEEVSFIDFSEVDPFSDGDFLMFGKYFYHRFVRTYVLYFGTLFNNIDFADDSTRTRMLSIVFVSL